MESNCIVCSKPIPRGQRFVGSKYKNIKFCCEDCYNQYCDEKTKAKSKPKTKQPKIDGWREMTDYISGLYPYGSINWMLFSRQIKSLMNEYDLTCDDIRIAIRYAVEFEGYTTNPEWGIGQFIPKYVEPSRRFREQIANNNLMANGIDEVNQPIIQVKHKSTTRKYYGKVEEF